MKTLQVYIRLSCDCISGLNACLDHRGEVYIPELCKSFKVGAGQGRSRFIACMNPVDQGAGRKALPKSFLNRFVKVTLYYGERYSFSYEDLISFYFLFCEFHNSRIRYLPGLHRNTDS